MGRLNRFCRPAYSVIIVALILAGCAAFTQYGKLEKSARQSYLQGNYDAAFYQCAQALKMKPDYAKAQSLIQEAYRNAVSEHETRIRSLKQSSAKFKWDDVVSEYEQLIKINHTVNSLPTLTVKQTGEAIKFDTKDYSKQISDARKNAADAHYQEGDRLSKVNTLDCQKQAAKEFKKAQYYVPGYRDASERYEVCRKAGIKRMAIIPFENRSGKTQYGAIEEMITDDIITNVMNDPNAMEFLEIVSRDQLMQVMQEQKLGLTGVINDQTAVELGKVLGVHELLTGKITQIIYTPPRTASQTYSVEREVADHKEKYYNKKGKLKERWVWVKVSADITEYTKTAGASINGSYQIIDVATAKIKKSQSFKGSSHFQCKWGVFTGDKRALSDANKQLLAKTEQFAPPAEELVNEAARNLSNSLASTLKAYAQ